MNLTLARGALFLVASLLFGALDARCIVQVPPDPVAAAITTEQVQITSGVTLGNVLPLTVTTLVREYVWGPGDGPGGVDELLVQYAASDRGKPWWVLQDGGGDVAALVETPSPGAQAVVAGQWTYDAYGSCLTAEHLRAYPPVHCGHKALFFDRLDVGVVGSSGDEIARLVPYAHAVYQMRNRAYAPALGRFLQSDPNATALALLDQVTFHGHALAADTSFLDLSKHFRDGANTYQYVRSRPWTATDPLGLDDEEEDDEGYTGKDLFEDVTDAISLLSPLPGPGDIIREMFKALTEDYGANLDWDVRWASNWSLSDDDHSRGDDTWVPLALGRGFHDAFDIGLPGSDASVNPLDALARQHRSGGPSVSVPSTGGRSVRGGYTIHVRRGQQAHANYRHALGHGYEFEVRVPGGRVDAIDVNNKILRELKPDTPSGRALGVKQLNRYVQALRNHPNPRIRGNYTPVLDTYRP